jgi:hypothetical protein
MWIAVFRIATSCVVVVRGYVRFGEVSIFEVEYSSETLATTYTTARCHNPEDRGTHSPLLVLYSSGAGYSNREYY